MAVSRPERAPDPKLGSVRSWMLPILLVALQATSIGASSLDCCPGATWISDSPSNCSDGTHIRLNCPYGFYSLDPSVNHFDDFTIEDEINPHLVLQHGHHSIPAYRFCVSGVEEENKLALICFEDDETPVSKWRYALFGILSLMSATFLCMTLFVYAVLPELRDIQDKSMATSITFLTVSYLFLGIEQIRPHEFVTSEDMICIPLAFLLYWSFLSAFFWMNMVSFNVWRTVWFKYFPIKDKDLFRIFCGIGFVGPSLFLLAALAAHNAEGYHLKPRFGEGTCWFGGNSETWAFFYGPITVLLCLNVIYLGLTCWRLWYEYRGYTGSGLKALRFNCLLYVKLVLVMGGTWIFEVISFVVSPRDNDVYWLATDIFNSLQGIIIFILLVLTRKRVKKLLARRRPLGISFPKSWAAYDEEDEIAYAIPIEVELANA